MPAARALHVDLTGATAVLLFTSEGADHLHGAVLPVDGGYLGR